jgi:DNA-binding NarL/FixJ family response regulator
LVDLLKGAGAVEVVTNKPLNGETMAQLAVLRLDVVLVQVLSREESLFVRSLHQLDPQVRLIGVGIPEVDDVIVACVQAGVSEYMRHEATVADLVSSVHATIEDQPPIPPATAAALVRHVAASASGSSQLVSSLTDRERQIVYCLREGLSNKEIAGRLGIDVSTVKNHIHSILQKLRVRRRTQAAAALRLLEQPSADLRGDLGIAPDPN